jgi:hypothetical protein
MNSLHITPWYTVRYGYERVSRAAAEEMTIRVPEADPTNMYATVKITPETPLQKKNNQRPDAEGWCNQVQPLLLTPIEAW